MKKLEELGIGRPSTYATTITTIQNREYVVKGDKPGESRTYAVLTLKGDKLKESEKKITTGSERGKLMPTDTGLVVNDFLLEHFPQIMDYNFTADVEKSFDDIAEGKEEWTDMMQKFYRDFNPQVESTMQVHDEHHVGERILGKDPKTGSVGEDRPLRCCGADWFGRRRPEAPLCPPASRPEHRDDNAE